MDSWAERRGERVFGKGESARGQSNFVYSDLESRQLTGGGYFNLVGWGFLNEGFCLFFGFVCEIPKK